MGSVASADTPPVPRETIYVVNQSSVPTWKLREDLPAFQAALDGEFARAWNVSADLVLTTTVPWGGESLILKDDSGYIGVAGYHTLSAHGTPYGVIGVRSNVAHWTGVFTHELFELLVDPYVDRASFQMECSFTTGCLSKTFYLVEVADPVELSAYTREGSTGKPVWISDFVLPSFFTGKGHGPFDYMGLVTKPHQILHGGYAYVYASGRWQEVDEFGHLHPTRRIR